MSRVKSYESQQVAVTFDPRRCIHAAECVRGLPQVFDAQARPWIRPERGEASSIMDVVARCPSGALQARPMGDGPGEQPDALPRVRATHDGPLHVRGRIEILDGDGNVVGTGTRVALCRCGASANKPFCDNSHLKVGFRSGA